jgi:hypothetical protein
MNVKCLSLGAVWSPLIKELNCNCKLLNIVIIVAVISFHHKDFYFETFHSTFQHRRTSYVHAKFDLDSQMFLRFIIL